MATANPALTPAPGSTNAEDKSKGSESTIAKQTAAEARSRRQFPSLKSPNEGLRPSPQMRYG